MNLQHLKDDDGDVHMVRLYALIPAIRFEYVMAAIAAADDDDYYSL